MLGSRLIEWSSVYKEMIAYIISVQSHNTDKCKKVIIEFLWLDSLLNRSAEAFLQGFTSKEAVSTALKVRCRCCSRMGEHLSKARLFA